MKTVHTPVLLNEVVKALGPSSTSGSKQMLVTYLDGTLGGAGHAVALAEAYGGQLSVIALDRDDSALVRAKDLLDPKVSSLILLNEDFRNIESVLDRLHVSSVDRILLDLGISSDELENSGRGFSFQKDEPLLMTMDDPSKYLFTAKDIVNIWDEDNIADVIYGYGEERLSRRIARAIAEYRSKKIIETSKELAEIVKQAYPGFLRHGRTHPATKTFQALRIAVNDELGALKAGLEGSINRLNIGGRLAVISFHSLEDRIVKNFFKSISESAMAIILTKKPIVPSLEEISVNPRSRSAKLRIIEKIN